MGLAELGGFSTTYNIFSDFEREHEALKKYNSGVPYVQI
jgi:hypothetical protein